MALINPGYWKSFFSAIGLSVLCACAPTMKNTGTEEAVKPVGKLKLRTSKDVKDSMFGLNIFNAEDVEFASQMGVCFVRSDIPWDRIEKQKGKLDYQKYDDIIARVKAAKLKGIIILCYGNKLYGGTSFFKTKEGLDAWKKYVRETVSRYKDSISWWEIWNEENTNLFFPHSPEDYLTLLKETVPIIRQLQPQATICLGGTAHTDFIFVKKILDIGAADYIDVVAYHPYRPIPEKAEPTDCSKSYQEEVAHLKDLVSKYGKKLTIWNTEQGIQSAWPTSGYVAPAESSELTQAKHLLRRLVLEESLGLERSVIFYAKEGKMEDATTGALPNTKGIINSENKPKHAFYAIQNLCSIFDKSVKPANIQCDASTVTFPETAARTGTVIEAENALEIVAPMQKIKDKDASGTFCIGTPDSIEPFEAKQISYKKHIPGKSDGKGSAKYEFETANEGKYYIFARLKAPHMLGTSNSFFVQIDNNPEFMWEAPETGDNWEWSLVIPFFDKKLKQAFPFPLSAGKHILKIRTREDGATLDKLLISTSPEPVTSSDFATAPLMKCAFENSSGIPMLSIWKATSIIDWQRTIKGNATVRIKTDKIKNPVLVDLLSKEHLVYELNDFEKDGDEIVIRNVPIADYPVLITDKSVITLKE